MNSKLRINLLKKLQIKKLNKKLLKIINLSIYNFRTQYFKLYNNAGVKKMVDVSDNSCNFFFTQHFVRMRQKYDVFNRAQWDNNIKSKRSINFFASHRLLNNEWFRRGVGFKQQDYSIRNAAWHISDIFSELRSKSGEDRHEGFNDPLSLLRDGPTEKIEFDNIINASKNIKTVSRVFGASLVGIVKYDKRWHYTKKFTRYKNKEVVNKLLEEEKDDNLIKSVIIIAKAMDHDLIKCAPSALSSAATGLGYGHDVSTILSIAQYIKNLGYLAVPSMNDSALAIPYAIQAGLGEYGRNGLLITPRYGSRVRLGKIFTNMKLAYDLPIRFGVQEFCQQCNLCAKNCPAQAISYKINGGINAEEEILNISNISGIRKWSTNAEKCFKYWTKINTDCSVCIRVCPYTRGNNIINWLWRVLAGVPLLRGFMLQLDNLSKRGKRMKPRDWWKQAYKNQ